FREGRYGPAVLEPTAEIERFTAEGFPVLADLRVLYPSRHDRVTAANTNFVNEHPELLKAFLRGMIRSCRYVLDPQHGPAFRDLVVRAGFLTTESELESFDDLFGGWQSRGTRDLALPREGVDLIVHEAQQAGQLSDSFQTDQVLRLDILAQAQRELIEA
ncbi:MAG: hypothetical protein QOF51_3142, partial [Chloroflexota bacterium]|nr:hypothetical protein [Chloroflexota bacterium]